MTSAIGCADQYSDDCDESGTVPGQARELEIAAGSFLEVRPRLFVLAYRILRDAARAEDIVQDAWLRWQNADRANVRDARAFLAATTIRLAINDAQSARCRHEYPSGSWLPESPESADGPEARSERGEAIRAATLSLLARLGATERAAYVLREVFDYPYERIAVLLGTSPANCRQLVRRARQRIPTAGRRPVSPRTHRRFLAAFVAAARQGNLSHLEALLISDAAPRPRERTSPDDEWLGAATTAARTAPSRALRRHPR